MVWLKYIRYAWLFFGLFLAGISLATENSAPTDQLYAYYNKNASLSYFEDVNDEETIESIWHHAQWLENTTGRVLNFGFVDYPVWIRFPVQASQLSKQHWHLVIPYPLLQKADVYLMSDVTRKVVWSSSLRSSLTDKSSLQSHHINFALPHENISGPLSIYLRVESNTSLQVPLEMWERKSLIVQQNVETLLWGLYFGVMLALILYNGFLFASMRDVTYAFYVLSLISVVMLMLSISGFGYRYVWNSMAFTALALPLSATIGSFWLLCFALSFLKAESINFSIRILMQILAAVALLVSIFVFYVPEVGAYTTGYIGAVTIVLMTLAGLSALVNGQVIARYFVSATAAFALGAILYLANVFGLVPSSRITNHAIQAGSVLEALLFSFALAHRIKEERRQKLIAMKKMEQAQRIIVEVQNQALQQALHDPVTRKPNESLLNNRIGELIADIHQLNSFALVLISFPQLKQISSSMGRRLAKEVFESVIDRLENELTNDIQSIPVELANDGYVAVEEFGSLIFMCKTGEGFRSVYDFVGNLIQSYENAIRIGETSIKLDACCGIASYPKHGDRAELLLQHACSARDYGLRTGEILNIYSAEIDDFGRRRLALVGALSQAVKERELEVYLQPQFECGTQSLVGAEVLLRWNSEQFGVVSPVEFIEVGEEAGLMPSITRYVVEESFSVLKGFNHSSLPITISINLSIQNLVEAKFVPYVIHMAEKHMINLADVVFEITETSMSEDMETVIATLNQLAAAGSRISLDDYGTGYSSLAYLSRLPVHELKIDRSFVQHMEHLDSNYRIVENTVKLARALQIETVAEGVENISTLGSVSRLGCNRVQGFYFAKPMPVSQFREWVMRRAS